MPPPRLPNILDVPVSCPSCSAIAALALESCLRLGTAPPSAYLMPPIWPPGPPAPNGLLSKEPCAGPSSLSLESNSAKTPAATPSPSLVLRILNRILPSSSPAKPSDCNKSPDIVFDLARGATPFNAPKPAPPGVRFSLFFIICSVALSPVAPPNADKFGLEADICSAPAC